MQLWDFPIATVSSAAFYALLLCFAFPGTRGVVTRIFAHPIPPHQSYLYGFDTLRGFAAALVAIGHCWWATYPVFAKTQGQFPFLAYGAKGVPIFAVLSGFLIYRSALGSIQSIEKLRAYAIRRFFRIYPVYALAVILCFLTGQYVDGPYTSVTSAFFADLFALNVFDWPGFANPPAWSLYVEIAFYAFLPIMVLVVPRKWVVQFCLVGIVVMILADYESRVFALWRYFLVGIVAAELSPRIKPFPSLLLFCSGLILFVIDFRGINYDWVAKLGIGRLHQDGMSIGLGLACGLMFASLPNLTLIGRALNVAPLRMIGVISYSVYLTHFFYIKANFPEIGLFTKLGTQPMYDQFSRLPMYSQWYLPLVFFPGVFFWGAVSFLLIERPGMLLGKYLLNNRAQRTAGSVFSTSERA